MYVNTHNVDIVLITILVTFNLAKELISIVYLFILSYDIV